MQHFENINIKNYTSLKIGGLVKSLFFAENIVDIQTILKSLDDNEKSKIRILGGGTNILVDDSENKVLDLIIIKLVGDFEKINIEKNNYIIKVGSGAELQSIIIKLIKNNIFGMEVLAGIPGTIGGAVAGNSGTKYGDIAQFIKSIQVLNYNGVIENYFFNNSNDNHYYFQYRNANFLKDRIICYIELDPESFIINKKVIGNENVKILEKYKNFFLKKTQNQPYYKNTAGCVFKNIDNFSIGKIIDEFGLKGFRIGSIYVSEKHANFLIADEHAHFADFIALTEFIKNKVKKEKGLELEFEIKIWE
ncbi:MAG: UDP-N-acetylmuramate dehydrogenase [Elusimicrobiota bacterium]|jgi:UDP-N-acetylmuramate dehydrogenase|nr:UDP-N-acetylmuramate dehydrogenase [Elusimicrobiota bacterium]